MRGRILIVVLARFLIGAIAGAAVLALTGNGSGPAVATSGKALVGGPFTLIDQNGKDWAAFLRDWMPPLPSSFTLWLVNRFGDTFVVFEDDGSVHMLDVGAGTLTRVADDRSHFADLLDTDDNADNWLMISLVDECRKAGISLSPSQCYGFKIPPVLGGKYEPANVEPTDLGVHYSFLVDIYKQTKDLPDGTPIEGTHPGST